MRLRAVAVATTAAMVAATMTTMATVAATGGKPGAVVLEVLSSRPDLVSGGDALVGVRLPSSVRQQNVWVMPRICPASAGCRRRPWPTTMA